jgi:hypothetical protein
MRLFNNRKLYYSYKGNNMLLYLIQKIFYIEHKKDGPVVYGQ